MSDYDFCNQIFDPKNHNQTQPKNNNDVYSKKFNTEWRLTIKGIWCKKFYMQKKIIHLRFHERMLTYTRNNNI